MAGLKTQGNGITRDYLTCQISRLRWCLDHHRLPNVYAEHNAKAKLMRLEREKALMDNDAYKPGKEIR